MTIGEKEYTHAIVEAALDCIVTMDHEGRVVEFNPAAERTFGYRREETIGQEMASLIIPPSLREAHRTGLTHYLATGEGPVLGTRLEITGMRKDGEEFPVELTITRLPSQGPPLFTGFLRDISERQQDERRLAAQYAVSRALTEVETVNEMAAGVLSAIGHTMNWEIGTLWQVEQEENPVLRCRTVWHRPGVEAAAFETATLAAAFPPGTGLPGRVWESGQAQWVQDVLTLPSFPRCHAAHAQGLRTALAFPIRTAEEVVGVIEFFRQEMEPPDEELLRVAEAIGNQVGQFLQRWRAEEALRAQERKARRRAEREALLNRIGQALHTTGADPDATQWVAIEALGQALSADRCYFARYDLARDRVVVGRDWHRPDLPSLAGTYRLSDYGLNPEVLYYPDTPLVIEDILDSSRIAREAAEMVQALGVRSVLGVGLFDSGTLVASLGMAMFEQPRAWTQEEVELVEAVAAQTRAAMEAARVRERERNIAERLQEALRPALPGKIPGLDVADYYLPALDEAEIGGDFFDVFSLEKAGFALVVADVSGKGLQAAAQVATVRHMLRTLLYEKRTVAEAVTRLNDLLTEHRLLTGFATLFAGVYDSNLRTLTYASCGQEPGLILRKATEQVEEMPPTGPVLGGFESAEFLQETLALSAGDVIALFTDGLTEAGTSRKDMLGIPGVIAVFLESVDRASSAEEITERMMAGVEALATPAGIRDDICLLVACVE